MATAESQPKTMTANAHVTSKAIGAKRNAPKTRSHALNRPLSYPSFDFTESKVIKELPGFHAPNL
jgi:hypothetical protein